MRDRVVLFIHFIATLARLLRPGGARSIVAQSLLLKHQLLILNRSRQRAPNLSASDRILAGWLALWLRPTRLLRSAIVLKPSTPLEECHYIHSVSHDSPPLRSICELFRESVDGEAHEQRLRAHTSIPSHSRHRRTLTRRSRPGRWCRTAFPW